MKTEGSRLQNTVPRSRGYQSEQNARNMDTATTQQPTGNPLTQDHSGIAGTLESLGLVVSLWRGPGANTQHPLGSFFGNALVACCRAS